MSGLQHLRLDRDERGVATVTFDVQGSPFNVFNDQVIGELRAVLDELEHDLPRVVVFRSGKASGFFAGADVNRIQQLETADEVRSVIDAGHEVFGRIEHLPCPTIAVIHGPCLGGGLEFALACRYRIARDDASTKFGLPEVTLGLIPGWGGTQRLPRVVGLREALRIILEGVNLNASKAAADGLVDVSAPPEIFDATVSHFIDDRMMGRSVRRPSHGLLDTLLDGTWPGHAVVLATARRRIAQRGRDYPAIHAALRAIEAGFGSPGSYGFEVEREEFVGVVFTPVARSLIGLFFQRERARKPATWVRGVKPAIIQKTAVVGAGTMGAGIAQLLAFNGIPVVLKDINDEIVDAGIKKCAALTDAAVAKALLSREAGDALMQSITPTSGWESLAGCDLVIEAVVEREEIKRTVFKDLAERLPNAVLASNTSALSVTRIADTTPSPERVAGLHFFNPVHKMQLVEVVRGRASNDATIATLVELVRKLGKVPVVVADSPGFLVNRTLFPYLDEAVRLVIEGVPGAEIDRAAVRFGMPMGPLELLDQIGVDIAADVSKTFAALSSDVGPSPTRFAEMVSAGALGKKSGHGFYHYHGDRRGKPTQWATPKHPHSPVQNADAGELSALQKRLMYPMINEAAKCLEAGVVAEAWMADLAMVLGTGFAPFRGGPLRTADTLGIERVVRGLDALSGEYGERFEAARLLRTLADEGRGFYADTQMHAHV
ncbi:MAG: multifunctional fatty acid oxidation complex subunit alpha [Planctomycetaceae bacterium]|nr:multifunctional fatty acid oxidation complex subunit alpha [Planctomycetaceae bacterium]